MKRTPKEIQPTTWAEVDLRAIRQNFLLVKKLAGRGRKILAVVKDDAYGHGMLAVASHLVRLGADHLAVGEVEEAVRLRRAGIKTPILVFKTALPSDIEFIVRYHLTPTILSLAFARQLNQYARSAGKTVNVHIKVDTGMGRLGTWHKEAAAFVQKVRAFSFLRIEGIYTHLAVADTERKFTIGQLRLFRELVGHLRQEGIDIPLVHASNSMGVLSYDKKALTMVRPGLMLYGLHPAGSHKARGVLKPALSVKSKILFVKSIEKGRSISYGRTFIARKRMVVATLPIGYSHGYFRWFSNKAHVLIHAKKCSVLGRVTMDQIVVDVSRVKGLRLGQETVILGRQQGARITADEMASWANTISYEITCSLGSRLKRVYFGA